MYTMSEDSTASVATKSIDVGSIFLMDLSVNESDLNGLGDIDEIQSMMNNDFVDPIKSKYQQAINYKNSINNGSKLEKNTPSIDSYNKHYAHQKEHYHHNNQHRHNNDRNHRQEQKELLLNNSIDRLATLINGNKLTLNNDNNSAVEQQPNSGIIFGNDDHHSATSSLSDKHFVASSRASTSSSNTSSCGDNNSSISDTSYTASCSEVDDNSDHERASTTREDSGVLDMKDLVGSRMLNNSFKDNQIKFNNSQFNKQISNNITATNLINNQSPSNNNDNCYVATTEKQTINRPTDNPTNNQDHNYHHNNYHHNHIQGSRRSVSASLPIQVPTRQMKKDLRKLKLGLINNNNNNKALPIISGNDKQDINTATSSTAATTTNINEFTTDEFDEFLEQEYNDNHHNHYPSNEYDMEQLRADENPMKLFESIQALARSLHEDAGLFGSLPPKRLLESPIRSMVPI